MKIKNIFLISTLGFALTGCYGSVASGIISGATGLSAGSFGGNSGYYGGSGGYAQGNSGYRQNASGRGGGNCNAIRNRMNYLARSMQGHPYGGDYGKLAEMRRLERQYYGSGCR